MSSRSRRSTADTASSLRRNRHRRAFDVPDRDGAAAQRRIDRSSAGTGAVPLENRLHRQGPRRRTQAREDADHRLTTGSTARVEIRRGERLRDTVEVEEFPETVTGRLLRYVSTATSIAKTGPTSSSPAKTARDRRNRLTRLHCGWRKAARWAAFRCGRRGWYRARNGNSLLRPAVGPYQADRRFRPQDAEDAAAYAAGKRDAYSRLSTCNV